MSPILKKLLEKGVKIVDPRQVYIGDEVKPDNIESGVILYPGTRISGSKTFLGSKSIIAEEGPLTLKNVRTGPEVQLKGGYFEDAVFLEGAKAGLGSHVREGTILEEKASIAHSTALKQSILFPYITLGSLVNFCDILMTGGTGPDNHGEVGSSYIHFNFTPNQDKATASLLGDVPSGVMLDKPPVFLGGQGGLVGPSRIAFGSVLAAGNLQRKDVLKENRLVFSSSARSFNLPRTQGTYLALARILKNNFIFIANLHALKSWYSFFRTGFISDIFPDLLLKALIENVDTAIEERIKRLIQLKDKVVLSSKSEEASINGLWQKNAEKIADFLLKEDYLDSVEINKLREKFLKDLNIEKDNYLKSVHSLSSEKKDQGRTWLNTLVDLKTDKALKMLSL